MEISKRIIVDIKTLPTVKIQMFFLKILIVLGYKIRKSENIKSKYGYFIINRGLFNKAIYFYWMPININ